MLSTNQRENVTELSGAFLNPWVAVKGMWIWVSEQQSGSPPPAVGGTRSAAPRMPCPWRPVA